MAEQLFNELNIVVVTYNTPIELLMCISSVKLFTKHARMIIVENGDDEHTWEYAKEDKLIKTVIRAGNLGFCKGLNRGVEEVDTEWFAVLPADCMLTEGWENRMMYQVPTLENPGIVATMCTNTSGNQGIEQQGLYNITQKVGRVILNGAVMRKEDFLLVGRMDEGFPNKGGNFSDDDLAKRFVKKGFNNYILNHVIHHNQGRSYGGRNEKFMKDFKAGAEYYKRKWKEEAGF
jgi:GT2 family glycosyltransferase